MSNESFSCLTCCLTFWSISLSLVNSGNERRLTQDYLHMSVDVYLSDRSSVESAPGLVGAYQSQ